MATDDVLSLTDGTTTLDLLRGPLRLGQDGWAPALARRRSAELGGLGEWEDVAEQLQLEVIAAAGDNPGARWSDLARLLAQAERWARGDPAAAAVRLRARPAGSRLTAGKVLEAAVIGGDAQRLHAQFFRMLEGGGVPPSESTVRRRGAWLDPAFQEASGTAAASQTVQTCTFATSHPTESPVALAIVATTQPTVSQIQAGSRLLVGPASTAFLVIEGESLADGTDFISTAAADARGGAYLQLSAVSPQTSFQSPVITIAGFATCEVYVTASNTRASEDCVLTLAFAQAASVSGNAGIVRLAVRIPANSPPQCYYVGRLAMVAAPTRMWIEFATDTGGAFVRLDAIVLHRDDGPLSAAVEIGKTANDFARYSNASLQNPLTIVNTPLALPAPVAAQGQAASPWALVNPVETYGDPYIESRGQTIAILPLLLPGTNLTAPTSTQFLPRTSAPANVTFVVTARRYLAYLSLE